MEMYHMHESLISNNNELIFQLESTRRMLICSKRFNKAKKNIFNWFLTNMKYVQVCNMQEKKKNAVKSLSMYF